MLSNDENADLNCNYNTLEDIIVINLNKYIPIKKKDLINIITRNQNG